jgi:hypothetical protein
MKFIDKLVRDLNAAAATEVGAEAVLAATSAGRGHWFYWLGTASPRSATPVGQVFNSRRRMVGQVSLVGGVWRGSEA